MSFFLLLFALSVPFWILDTQVASVLPAAVPLAVPPSVLMAFLPAVCALIITRQASGPNDAKQLLRSAANPSGIRNRAWYLPILLLMPAITVVEYGLMRLLHGSLPPIALPLPLALPLLAVFLLTAVGEEIGWQGLAARQLQPRLTALQTGLTLGVIWALWHIPGFYRMHPDISWVAWQCAATVATRVVIVWLSNNNGRSLLAAALFHATINFTVFWPNFGATYDPALAAVVIGTVAVTVTALWGPGTLARYRFAWTRKAHPQSDRRLR